jgi:hypothetical protein
MNIQLLKGKFSSKDAIDLLTQLAHVKIKYHENKIKDADSEEDIKMRETRIKEIQKDLFEARKHIESSANGISLESLININ